MNQLVDLQLLFFTPSLPVDDLPHSLTHANFHSNAKEYEEAISRLLCGHAAEVDVDADADDLINQPINQLMNRLVNQLINRLINLLQLVLLLLLLDLVIVIVVGDDNDNDDDNDYDDDKDDDLLFFLSCACATWCIGLILSPLLSLTL